jgi:hypothetical protein
MPSRTDRIANALHSVIYAKPPRDYTRREAIGNAPIPVSLPCRGSMMSGGGAGASSGASRGEPHTGQTGAGQQMYSTGSARRMTVRTLLLPVHAQAASGFRNGTTQ